MIAFRGSALTRRQRRRLGIAVWMLGALGLLVVGLAAWLPGPLVRTHAGSLSALLPSAYLGFFLLALASAAANGGGREVIPRDQAVALPISPLTEHLGALLMAPLNIAWLLQSLTLLGATAYAFATHHLLAVLLPVLVWIAAATALAQLLGWLLEGVRRGPRGIPLTRALLVLGAAIVVTMALTHRVGSFLDHAPTRFVLDAVFTGSAGGWVSWLLHLAVLVALLITAVLLGGPCAAWALGRPETEELRLESGRHPARPDPRSPLVAVLRLDRAAVWRAVPLRRGIGVLALFPGAVALAGAIEWRMLAVLPGLVASGAALLFGVNAWCLDGRGALWRESLPVPPGLVFGARVIVLLEILLGTATLTVVVASLRAGTPTMVELTSVLVAIVVVAAQVTATAMTWSVNRPFSVDMRSARATPAPPLVMVGYSARLAWWTTLTGLIFTGAAQARTPWFPVLIGVPMLCWSLARLDRARARWADDSARAATVATVAA